MRSARSSRRSTPGIFNPGKIVDAPPLTANLRFGPKYAARNPVTFFDYAAGGVAGAIEMCSGLGACRKPSRGRCAPRHGDTRGAAPTCGRTSSAERRRAPGRVGPRGSRRIRNAGPLLECRACKAECPVGVDVARFKSEFLSDYWQRHGTPVEARMLGNVSSLARWGSRFAPLSNWIAGSAPVRRLNQRLFADERRRLPHFKRQTLRHLVRDEDGQLRPLVQRHVYESLRPGDRSRRD